MKDARRKKLLERLGRQSRAEAAEYWDGHDSSWAFEGKPVRLEAGLAGGSCRRCGGSRLCRSRADLPLPGGRLTLNGVDLLMCLDCSSWAIADEARSAAASALEEARSSDTSAMLDEAIAGWVRTRERARKRKERRRIVTFYFPGRTNGPHAAKLSIRSDDPLLGRLRSRRSAEVRAILGIDSYDDLECAARAAHRSVSQFMRMALAEKLAGRRPPVTARARSVP